MTFHIHLVIIKADLRGLQDTSKIIAKDWIRVIKILLIRRDHAKLYNIIGRIEFIAIILYFVKY